MGEDDVGLTCGAAEGRGKAAGTTGFATKSHQYAFEPQLEAVILIVKK